MAAKQTGSARSGGKGTTSSSKKSTTRKKNSKGSTRRKGNKGKRRQSKKIEDINRKSMYDEVELIIALAISVLLLLSIYDLCGVVGRYISTFIFGIFGWIAYFIPYIIFLGTAFYISNRHNRLAISKILFGVIAFLAFTALFQWITDSSTELMSPLDFYEDSAVYKNGGGLIGGMICGSLEMLFGQAGTLIILIAVLAVSIVFMAGKSVFVNTFKNIGHALKNVSQNHQERKARKEEEKQARKLQEAEKRKRQEEQERLEAEERKRQEAKRQEQERLEAEERKRQEVERQEQERLEAEERKRQEVERQEQERLEAEERKRLGAERQEQERLEAEERKRQEVERQEQERQEAEERKLQEAERQEQLEAERLEREQQEEQERKCREEKEFKEAEERKRQEEQERLDAENAGHVKVQAHVTAGDRSTVFNYQFMGKSSATENLAAEDQTAQDLAAGDLTAEHLTVKNSAREDSTAENLKTEGRAAENRATANQAVKESVAQAWKVENVKEEEEEQEDVSMDVTAKLPDLSPYIEKEETSIAEEEILAEEDQSATVDAFQDVKAGSTQSVKTDLSQGVEEDRSVEKSVLWEEGKTPREEFTVPKEEDLQEGFVEQPDEEQEPVWEEERGVHTQSEMPQAADAVRKAAVSAPVVKVKAKSNAELKAAQEISQDEIVPEVKEYVFPPINLLKRGLSMTRTAATDRHLQETAKKLQETLESFGVKVKILGVSCGPSVTRYELAPAQGVKVSKILALTDDIKLSLAVADIRIEAPIPGKSAIGIEVPNKENHTVMLRDLLESSEFKNSKAALSFAVGRDISGNVVVSDIAKMPHLLIAGATGSGKSVCINTLIMSIIYKSKPEDVRMIMIDPKVVELSVYNGIPHLLIPVVTDPKKAAGALNWAVAEMEKRYKKFEQINVRDLKSYNEKVAQIGESEDHKKMPRILIIVDELADLMMVASSEVEDAICRLAQLARAAGLHLVIATQRPSVNVITGVIKANIPSRIAFEVSSGVDSRTIIDMNGAEKLLGKGDMLFYPAGYQKPVRVQGSFVSDQEINAVVEFLTKDQEKPVYNEEVASTINTGELLHEKERNQERDVYFAEAGRLIIEKDKASIGMLQRVYRIGFNRAARIMDQLCEAGVVGPEEGTKPRKVLMSAEEFEQYIEDYV